MSQKSKIPAAQAGAPTFPGPAILWRNGRAHGDFRAFADVGGRREPLAEPGRKWGTTDPEIALVLFSARLQELQEERRARVGIPKARRVIRLDELVSHHLEMKERAGRTSHSHLRDLEHRLSLAVGHFGPARDPRSIEAEDVRRWGEALARGGRRKPGTVRHYLNALSGVYRRALEGRYAEGNPVAELMEKPTGYWRGEAAFFEMEEAAILLEAARRLEVGSRKRPGVPGNRVKAIPGLHAMVATFLLTGGRKAEVLGLDLEDVVFQRGIIHFRPNQHRGLKTRTSIRSVPLWPQLREILEPWVATRLAAGGTGLLFPSPASGRPKRHTRAPGMVCDLRKSLDAMAAAVGMAPGQVRTRCFRHTYCSARLQTVQRILRPGMDPASPHAWEVVEVSRFQVQKEMGHGGSQLVDRVYGHAQRRPHRSEVVEYRLGESD